jgi:TPR repeat protein
MSADQGKARGQLWYARSLAIGEGVAKDIAESVRYMKMAVDRVAPPSVSGMSLVMPSRRL